jgi:hypothetical protein
VSVPHIHPDSPALKKKVDKIKLTGATEAVRGCEDEYNWDAADGS